MFQNNVSTHLGQNLTNLQVITNSSHPKKLNHHKFIDNGSADVDNEDIH